MTMRTYEEQVLRAIDNSLAQLAQLIAAIQEAEESEESAKRHIAAAKGGLDSREAELLLEGAEGKNETERRAALRLKYESDAHWLSIAGDLHNAEVDFDVSVVKANALRREWQFHRIIVEASIAKLGFIGSEARLTKRVTNAHGSELYAER